MIDQKVKIWAVVTQIVACEEFFFIIISKLVAVPRPQKCAKCLCIKLLTNSYIFAKIMSPTPKNLVIFSYLFLNQEILKGINGNRFV